MNMVRKALLGFTGVAMGAMVLVLFVQILAREFGISIGWTEELARFSFIAMVFVATSYATLNNSHLRVSVFADWLKSKLGPAPVEVFHASILLLFSMLMTFYAGLNYVEGFQYKNISPATGINQNFLFIFFVVGFALNSLFHFIEFAQALTGKSAGTK